MTAEERAALAKLCAAHPGPYTMDPMKSGDVQVPGEGAIYLDGEYTSADITPLVAKANAVPALLKHIGELEAEREALRVVAHAAMQVIAVSDGVVTWEIEHDALSNALREVPS